MNDDSLISQIYIKHPAFGEIGREAEESFANSNFSAALACLFMLLEGALKYNLELDSIDKLGLYAVIEKAKDAKIITESEVNLFHRLREIRNALFHENPYEMAIEINGLIYPYSEADTKELIYGTYSLQVFETCNRLLNNT